MCLGKRCALTSSTSDLTNKDWPSQQAELVAWQEWWDTANGNQQNWPNGKKACGTSTQYQALSSRYSDYYKLTPRAAQCNHSTVVTANVYTGQPDSCWSWLRDNHGLSVYLTMCYTVEGYSRRRRFTCVLLCEICEKSRGITFTIPPGDIKTEQQVKL